MFNFSTKIYLIVSLCLYIVLISKNSEEYFLINTVNIFSVISFYGILYINAHMKLKNYTRNYLNIEVFIYSLIFISSYNFISYFYSGDFFVFSKADALFYHNQTIQMINMEFGEAIEHYLSYMGTDDLGMILVLFPLYHIAESNIILNILYLFVGIVTSISIFSISQKIMSKKYAFLSTLSYSLSSFVLYFHSIGLKESFMVMLVVLSFDFYYKFIKTKNILYILLVLLFIGTILLFRPAVSVIIIASIGIGSLLGKKSGIAIKLVSLLILIFLISIGDNIIKIIEHYSRGGFDMLIYSREAEGMIIGSIPFTYTVNILSQLIGPLPTLVSSEKIMLTLIAPSLIYRVFLSFPFWMGAWYIYKTKIYIIYPLLLFVLMEMSSLALILEGLEFRKSLPHIAIVFIIAFWFMDKYDSRQLIWEKRKKFKLFYKFSILILILIIIFWNFK